LPAKPDTSERKFGSPGQEVLDARAGVVQGEETYVIERGLLSIQPAPDKYDAIFDSGKAFMQQKNPRLLKSEEKIKICGYEGRRYVLESMDGTRVTDHRVVIVGSEIFEFAYERPANQPPSAAAEAFFSRIVRRKT
jgi:hypothetical protein